jgi:SNF2 family DNA or RNA helicase
MIPLPHQIEGARWLAPQTFACLADEPRVGKTGAAIMAADLAGARTVLVVTTASGRAVLRKGFQDWSPLDRKIQIATPKDKVDPSAHVVIVGWQSISDPALLLQLLARRWDVALLDESHYAKSFEAKRTQATYGVYDDGLVLRNAIAAKAGAVWCLTGTPMPNSPFDLYPMLRFGAADRLKGVVELEVFKKHFCQIRPKKLGNGPWARRIDVIVGGRNLDELRQRIDGLFLRRTQQDVGIRAPIYETFPLLVSARARTEADKKAATVIEAIDNGDTKSLEMHLGPLRRLTGVIKAKAVVEAVREELDNGLDKIVLAYWHSDVAAILADGLRDYGVTGLDGSTPLAARERNVAAFQKGEARVFLGQIQAAGEAIDLSSASELMFVEMSFIPKDGKQMSLRVTNHTQTRQVRVRVAAIAGSIDEAIQSSLLRKVQTIQEVLQK